jgi:catechol 2,3-dioxygenase-like lactoylglutathione lyase family enzyme
MGHSFLQFASSENVAGSESSHLRQGMSALELRRSAPYNVGRMIRVGSIVLRVDDLQRQTEFWEAALDYVRREGDSDDFVLLRPRDGIGPNLSLDRVRSTLQIPPRIHLDLYTDDQAGEVERLLALGATEVHWDKRPPDADYVILADPEGNRFCVVDIS